MFPRIRIAIGFALAAILMTSIIASAKGRFSFINITGPDLKEAVRSTDPALTDDFFAFADFSRDKTKAPASPGTGYEITRFYIDGQREIAFDHLHYYPETGFVYYDGIAGSGLSEYDGKWYIAKPEIKSVFEGALSIRSMNQIQSSASTVPSAQTQSGISLPLFYFVVLATLGIAVIVLFTYRLRKSFSH